MSHPALQEGTPWTAADLVERFGPIPLNRIRHDPPPGTATEEDVVAIHDGEGRLFELVDGVLVEKTVGLREAWLAARAVLLLGKHLEEHDLGVVFGADAMMRLAPGLVRIPDASFVSWERLGGRTVPSVSMASFAPDLAVEVLSPSNTRREMETKLSNYFEAGVREAWYVDPRANDVAVHRPGTEAVVLHAGQSRECAPVLRGFLLDVDELFADR